MRVTFQYMGSVSACQDKSRRAPRAQQEFRALDVPTPLLVATLEKANGLALQPPGRTRKHSNDTRVEHDPDGEVTMTNRLLVGIAAAGALALSATLVPSASAEDDTILIGAATATSGWMAPYDEGPTAAARMAIDEVNQAGGLLGKKL